MQQFNILKTAMSKRIVVLDSFRAVAALSVLLFHLTNRHFAYGHYGVQFFFIISGFVIFNTIGKIKSGNEFIIRRFFRLYPTYWACVIITTLVINFFSISHEHISGYKFLANFTMIQELLNVENIDTSYWSLLPELFFYGLILILYWTRQLKNIEIIGLLWIVLILIAAYFKIETKIPLIRILNIRHGQLFLSGIMFYKIYKGAYTKRTIAIIILCYLCCLYVYPVSHPDIYPVLSNAIIISIIFFSFVLFIKGKLSFLANKQLQFIGLISYPVYLLHQKIGLILLDILNSRLPQFAILNFVLVTLLIILVSYCIYRVVEKPVQHVSKFLVNRLNVSNDKGSNF
jgi:peptidoglycan/LPS O-acetylase OafA/YrhL